MHSLTATGNLHCSTRAQIRHTVVPRLNSSGGIDACILHPSDWGDTNTIAVDKVPWSQISQALNSSISLSTCIKANSPPRQQSRYSALRARLPPTPTITIDTFYNATFGFQSRQEIPTHNTQDNHPRLVGHSEHRQHGRTCTKARAS